MYRISAAIISILSLLSAGCDNDNYYPGSFLDAYNETKYYPSEIIPATHQNLYGKWKLDKITGGFSGAGAPNDYDYLEIKKFGIYGLVRDNKVFEFGKIELDTFDVSQPDVLQIRFVPEHSESAILTDYTYHSYVYFERGGMQLWVPMSDAYVREFVKEPIELVPFKF